MWLIIITGLLILAFAAFVYTLVRIFKFRLKWISRLLAVILPLSIFPFAVTRIIHRELSHPFIAGSLLATAVLVFIIGAASVMDHKRAGWKDRIIPPLAIAGIIITALAVIWIHFSFDPQTIYQRKLSDKYYYRIVQLENGLWSDEVLSQNPVWIEQTHDVGIVDFILPDEVKYISSNDSVLDFSVTSAGKQKIHHIDLRFDCVLAPRGEIREVRANGRFGAIDSSGKIVIPLVYDDYTAFAEVFYSRCSK
jgi:hypothetical protein